VRLLYTLLWIAAMPLVLLRLFWRSLKAPAYRLRWAERFGRFPPPNRTGGIWIHAVSVGEAQAVQPLIRRLLQREPSGSLVVTTTTPTGSARVRELFGEQVFHVYFPFDLPWAVRGFLDRIQPSLAVLVETEVWPNLLGECNRRRIPVLLANGRLSERSARGYRRLGSLSRETFARFSAVAAQSEADAQRFVSVGVPPGRLTVTGSIKFDQSIRGSVKEQAEVVRREWGVDRPVWVAASTHEGEEDWALDAHERVMRALPDALLVLVPRHPERFDRVAQLVQRRRLAMWRRTQRTPPPSGTAVFLGDTMGELPVFLAAADAAFVGGSLLPVGGHNVLEPAALGVPVAFGPHMFNFAQISQMLLDAGAAEQVDGAAALGETMQRWLGNASLRTRVGENGRRVVEVNRGALERVLRLVDDLLREAG
jgi:3-deoxy-D-manno-octulosonic-acid transferase